MGERHYPDISEASLWPLKLVRKHLEEDPAFLNGPECPYSGDVKRFLALLSPAAAGTKSSALANAEAVLDGDEVNEGLEANLNRLRKELSDYKQTLGKGDKTELASYFRLSTTLLEKLVTAEERIHNVERMKEFEGLILSFLEDHCTADQRTKLMDYLKGL